MNTLAIRFAWLALLFAPMLALADSGPQIVVATPGIGNGAIERFTVRFSAPMVPLSDPRAASPFTVDCAVGGQGRWIDQQSFVHEFARPLPGGTRCTFKMREGLKSIGGYALVGQKSFTVDAGGPFARAVLPGAYGSAIEEDQVFLVAANMPPAPGSVTANAYCTVEGVGEKIPVELLGSDVPAKLLAALGTGDYAVQSFLEEAGLPAALPGTPRERQAMLASVSAVKCRRPLPPGRDVALMWPAGIAGAGGTLAGEDRRFDFTVRKPFAARFECSRVNPQAGCSPVEKAWVRFSAPIAAAQARQIRIELPGGRTLAAKLPGEGEDRRGDARSAATVSEVSFATPLPADTGARLVLPAGIRDESGRALTNADRFPLAIRFDEAPPLVKFAGAFGILEAAQGGVLPVTVRNVEPALQGRNLKLGGRMLRVGDSDAAVARWLGLVDHAGDYASHEEKRGTETVTVNDTGSRPVLAGGGAPLSLALPGKGRDFEVVGIPLGQPGFYVVELASPRLGAALLGRPAPRYVASAALVTNMAVHFKWGRAASLAWVTTLDRARPVAGAEVRVSDGCTGATIATGRTGANGSVRFERGLPPPESYGSCPDADGNGGGSIHPLMISARAAGDFSFTLTRWGEGIAPGDFDLPYGYSPAIETLHTVFDRALIRQGETVHMKHLLRLPVAAGFAMAPALKGTLRLQHLGSDTVFELPLAIGASGSGESAWTAPKGAPLGDYSLSVVAGDRTIYTNQSVRVDEYRLPTMRASVSGPKAAVVKPRTLPVDLFVGYLSGGGAANLPVDLRIGWFGDAPTPADYGDYSFGGRPITEGVRPMNGDGEDEQTPLPPTQTIPVKLGADGTARQAVEVPAALDGLANMRVEMDYQDANGEVLTAARSITIYPSAVQLGAKTDGWLMKHDDLRLRFVALDTEGRPIKGQRIDVALYSREILTARRRLIGGFYAYENQVRTRRLDARCTATTDAQGLAACRIDPGISGEVYAVATTRDGEGRVARAVRSVWLAGADDWWFGGDNGDRMDLIPERPAYAAGATARLQVRMPFRRATALVTVEREGVLASFVTEISGKDPVVSVPLPASYAPDVYVSVLAVRGRVEPGWWDWLTNIGAWLGITAKPEPAPPATALVDLSKPAYRLGIARLKVGWEGHRLAVQVKADRARYAPRGTAQVAVAVARPDGKPAASADLAFIAVDKALDQIAPNESTDVLAAMMGDRPLSVLTATAQTQVVGKRHYGRKAVAAGGGGGESAALNRENFQPVLLWRGHVPLDAQGRGRLAVPISDALSAFRLVAVATDGAQLFGSGETEIRSAQDLSIFAGLPPLVRGGDRFGAVFTLRNGADRAMTVTANVAVSPRIATGRPLTVTIPAGGAVPVMWNLVAPEGEGNLRWQVDARSADGRAVDRITVDQQLVHAVPLETWAATLTRVGSGPVPVAAPAGALPGRGDVTVQLSDTLAPPLAGVRDYMTRYPFNCFEQQLSRIVALGDTAGWARLAGELPIYQARDGLLRYWPSDSLEGSEALTAYVVALTADAGLPLPDGPRARMIEGLRAVIDGRVAHESYGDPRLRRLAAFAALARAGAATPAMLGQLQITPREMPTAQLADYLVALDRVPGLANAPALRGAGEAELRRRLVYEGIRLDLSDQSASAWWLMSSGDEGALKAVLAVLGRAGWQEEAPRMMAGAAARQARGHWDTTTANAWGSVAARRFATLYPASAIAGTTRAALGNVVVARGWPLAPEQRTIGLALPARQTPLLLTQSGGDGPWAVVSVRAAVPLTRALFAGYRIQRKVEPVQVRRSGSYTRGDVIKVTLTIDASAERNWVVVSDPVPAGATIIGDAANQSQLLAGGGSSGGYPNYVERAAGYWRGYYEWLPRGTTTVSYNVRLNGSGRFVLPPTHVEAMYAPAIRADLPNGPVTVAAN